MALFSLALVTAPAPALAYSPCEDVSVAGNETANPLKSEDAPATIVCNAELATVSDDSAVITWVTNRSAPSTVSCWGIDPSLPDCSRTQAAGIYHAVELTGLQPGAIYYFRIETGAGLQAPPTQQSPGIFRTLDSSGLGNHLFTFASLNDMHVGEGTSGQLTAQAGQPIPPSFGTPGCDQTDPNGDCYWAIMNRGAIAAINSRGAAFTIVKGDVTGEGGNCGPDPTGAQYTRAKTLLQALTGRFFPVRGNHDKSIPLMQQNLFAPVVDAGTENPRITAVNEVLCNSSPAACFPHASPTCTDPHLDFVFEYDAGGETFRFIALDTWDNDRPLPPQTPGQPPGAIGAGRITEDQFTWLAAQLGGENANKKTFLYMHHPTSEQAALTAVPPVVFGVRQPDAARFLEMVGSHKNVVGVLSAHTHRNWISTSALAPGVPFVETASVKEYPGGFAVYKVFEKGYLQSFYKCSTPECLEWSDKTRGEYLNLYPLYTSQAGALDGSFAYSFAIRQIELPEILP